jgi:hypothetical protein
MKKTTNNLRTTILSAALFACTVPFGVSAQTVNTPFLTSKVCLVKYQAEVAVISKLIDTKKADAKLLEIKSIRKEEDKTIKNIFTKIDEKIENQERKEIVDEKKELVLKAISERREKTDELQSNIRISKPEVEYIVKSTLVEVGGEENSKACPIRTDTSKEIRSKNIQKLKKLAADKKEIYQKQTKEIQDEFGVELRSALSELSEEITK